jgi:hypothetical protein
VIATRPERTTTHAPPPVTAEAHCEGMASIVFWTAAFDWLDTTGFARA